MKKYLAIGHFKENKNMTCVVMQSDTMKSFREDLSGNEFIPYIVVTEKMMKKYLNLMALNYTSKLKR